MSDRILEATCCVAGGGPAGLMLGLLLAKAGVSVVVLEKHGDFLRDFRGDTIHPSTLEVVHELGLLDEFLKLPHQKVSTFSAQFGERTFTLADFATLRVRCPYIAMMPQWDFLNFLAANGRKEAGYRLFVRTKAKRLIEEGGKVVGVRAQDDEGPLEVRADLVVAADGRHSTLRADAGLVSDVIGAPMDVLWFRLSRRPADGEGVVGRFDAGVLVVALNRGEFWQCAFVIPKGSIETLHARGLPAFRERIAKLAPVLADRVGELASWDDVKLLTVAVDRLRTWWKPGFVCIGDAAHAMSPVGGIGINLAIQDAVAAANILAKPLRERRVTDADLAALQARRAPAVKATQRAQAFLQSRVIAPTIGGGAASGPIEPPLFVRLLGAFPVLRRIPARLMGLGVRPEHWARP